MKYVSSFLSVVMGVALVSTPAARSGRSGTIFGPVPTTSEIIAARSSRNGRSGVFGPVPTYSEMIAARKSTCPKLFGPVPFLRGRVYVDEC